MIANLSVITPPANTLVTMDIACRHLRYDQPYDRPLINLYLMAAVGIAENYLNRSILTRTLQLTLGNVQNHYNSSLWIGSYQSTLPWYNGENWYRRPIALPYNPIQSVSTITRGCWGATDATLVQGTDYDVDLTTDPGRIIFYDLFNNFYDQDHVSITFTSGYGDTAASVPPQIIHAVLLILTNLYFNRGDDQNENVSSNAKSLLDPYVDFHFGSFYR